MFNMLNIESVNLPSSHHEQTVLKEKNSIQDKFVKDNLLSVQVNTYHVLLQLSEISELINLPNLTIFPLAKPWINGLSVIRSEVITVFNLEYCLNQLITQEVLHPWRLIDIPKSQSIVSSNKQDSKCVVLSKTVMPQLAFFSDKIWGMVNPHTKHSDLLEHKSIIPTTNFIQHIWKDINGQYCIAVSLSALLQSQAFNQLTF